MNAIEQNHFKRGHQVHFTIYTPTPFPVPLSDSIPEQETGEFQFQMDMDIWTRTPSATPHQPKINEMLIFGYVKILIIVLLHCGCLSLNPFIEFRIRNNSSSSDVLNIQASISISPKFEAK